MIILQIKFSKIFIMSEKFYVYIIQTENETLYCGYTTDVERRFQEHKSGVGAKYTRANKPVKIVYTKEFSTKSDALKEEYRIKHKLTRAQKLELIN